MNKQPEVYLELALRALERVPRFLAERTLQVCLRDEFCQAAVERQLEIAGYATLDHERVYDAATNKVPTLTVTIRNLLNEYPPGQ
jgi:uncharacterized protein with HEPN domain